MDKILCIFGESGSGKSSIVDKLKKIGYKSLDSYTTRARRYENEQNHTFCTEEEYFELKDKGEIVAYTYFNDNHYFCTKTQLKESDVYVIDVDGIKYLKEKCPDIEITSVYIKTNLFIRFFRLLKRDGFKKTINRMKSEKIKFKDKYNIGEVKVLNNNFKDDLLLNTYEIENLLRS
jgi:guanylate kinase